VEETHEDSVVVDKGHVDEWVGKHGVAHRKIVAFNQFIYVYFTLADLCCTTRCPSEHSYKEIAVVIVADSKLGGIG